ncbi:TetR/AcrR family transcriptional regulator [Nocardia vaccinii]|uniref:TetR/AcrR family transcriptional regulator n=1 Tax=Nocardia vaccinii TaxID=1822 RepID=UPI001471162E
MSGRPTSAQPRPGTPRLQPTPDGHNSTAQRIRRVAIHLIFEQGYAETTLRQIADASGLRVSSLYICPRRRNCSSRS